MTGNPILRLPVTLAKGFIRLYRLILSPWFGNQCRFHPTCSHYSEEAFEKHGFFKGLALTIWRIGRCAPWGKPPWIDPVPDRFAWRDVFGYKKSQQFEPNGQHSNKQSNKKD